MALSPSDNIVVVRSSRTDLTGIKGDLVLPQNYSATNNGADYFNFYFGFGEDYMEGGVSYSKKWGSNPWHKFLNNSQLDAYTAAMSQPYPGQRISFRLENNKNQTASFYINDNLVTTLRNPRLPAASFVKMAQGAGDYSSTVTYSQTSYSNLQYRDSNNTWHSWTSGYTPVYTYRKSDLNVYSELPLSTSLN
ncbi:hypothetical protein [Paenibacillus polymyxa]|uniref:hypothetical protein n=1 Tax=Paenibacillus polymyxa TaxID=1406 RepID=UPI00287F7F7E|nr:hypothetical protein [Paenibacillus polymyxa]